MRILYLHQYFTTPEQAGGTRSYEMARRLVQMGHQLHLLTSSAFLAAQWAPRVGWAHHDVEGIAVEVFRVAYSNRSSYGSRMAAFARFALAATMRGRRVKADVVLASSTPLTIAVPGVACARTSGAPFVFEVRDLWPEVPIALGALRGRLAVGAARALEHWAYRNARRVIALSPGMADAIAATGYPLERIAVIPNASDRDLFGCSSEEVHHFREGHPWIGARPLVVYAGTFGRVNGLSYFVRLAARVRELWPEVRFLAVGDGAEREALIDLARRLGVFEINLAFWPPIPKRELPPLLAAADLAVSFVLPIRALWNNSANKFFDALAAGTPLCINHEGWQADLLRRTGAGIVLDPYDVQHAAVEVVGRLQDHTWAQHARSAARRLAIEEFDRDLLAARLERVLLEAVS